MPAVAEGKCAGELQRRGIPAWVERGAAARLAQDRGHSGVVLDEGNRIPGLEKHYRVARTFRFPGEGLKAKTGFATRPQSLWVPKS